MSKRKEVIARRRRQKRQRLLIMVVVVVGLAFTFTALLIWPSLNNGKEIIIPENRALPFAEGTSLGRADAPVVIEDYSDFQCSHCRNFHQNTLPQIIDNYVATGQVRFEFRQYPFLGQESTTAANASLCAAEQGHFWEYADLLFANQAGIDSRAFSTKRLRAFAEILELDQDQFSICLEVGRYNAEVGAEFSAGTSNGVNSTPTFLINGQALVGAAPYADFQFTIEAALQNSN